MCIRDSDNGIPVRHVEVGIDQSGWSGKQCSHSGGKQVCPGVGVHELAQGPPSAVSQGLRYGPRRSTSAIVHDQCLHGTPLCSIVRHFSLEYGTIVIIEPV